MRGDETGVVGVFKAVEFSFLLKPKEMCGIKALDSGGFKPLVSSSLQFFNVWI